MQQLQCGAAIDHAALEREPVAMLHVAAHQRGAQRRVVQVAALRIGAAIRALPGGRVVRIQFGLGPAHRRDGVAIGRTEAGGLVTRVRAVSNAFDVAS